MTIKELDKKIDRIKKQLLKIETELVKEKHKKTIKKNSVSSKKTLNDEITSWENLRDQISSLWDGKLNSIEEIRAQRDKEYQ